MCIVIILFILSQLSFKDVGWVERKLATLASSVGFHSARVVLIISPKPNDESQAFRF